MVMMQNCPRNRFGLAAWLAWWMPVVAGLSAPAISPEIASNIVAHNENIWRACQKPSDSLSSRDLFAYALDLCEAREYPERLGRLFELAAQMQDRDPKSRGFGNFWWSRRDGKVMDYNAVDFCMRGGALLWLQERDRISAPAQQQLKVLLDFAVQGCLRHKVDPSYSNIAIMNAGDLILLGEVLGKPEAANEGYARLDRVYHYTQTAGIHEFDSPTYTGVDLDGLDMIEALCQRDSGRSQARALLDLFWTDIALNWFPPAQKLAGANSRTYDFPHGLGDLDRQLCLNGWLPTPPPGELDVVFSLQAGWHPPQNLHQLSDRFPRLVRASWGNDWWQSRTHYLLPDITLSCTASSYGGRMDMPLTVDLPGDRKSTRCYFVADGRDDPYGQKRIPAGAHQKAFHLNPFWTAAQRNGDVLGLVVYRGPDLPTNATTLVSDFVMPMDVDSFWIGDRQISLVKDQTFHEPVSPGQVVGFRKNNAVLGIRVPWSRTLDGQEAKVFLIHDQNPFGAVRLAVEHVAAGAKPEFSGTNAGAAFWLRIADGITSETSFTTWRDHFAADKIESTTAADKIQLQCSGQDGPVSLTAGAPWDAPDSATPAPTRAALELNGEDIGGKILADHQSMHD